MVLVGDGVIGSASALRAWVWSVQPVGRPRLRGARGQRRSSLGWGSQGYCGSCGRGPAGPGGAGRGSRLAPAAGQRLGTGIDRTTHKDTALLLARALSLAVPVRALFVAAARSRGPTGALAA